MKNLTKNLRARSAAVLLAVILSIPLTTASALACACGCSVFDVGASSLLPKEDDHGGSVYFEYDHSTQNKNWSGTSKAPASDNTDKKINTNWYSISGQYMFNRDWGIMAKLPYVTRSFQTDTGGNNNPADFDTFKSKSFGDAEIMGMYTGFSKDMSTGLIFGLKLPTGTFKAANIDRDTQIGTGSTDLILGAFHRGMLTGDNSWQYFMQIKWMNAIATQSSFNSDAGANLNYRPGSQTDIAIGLVYNNSYNIAGFDKIAPIFQVIASHRERDSGAASNPTDTGFDRVMISPGLDFTKVLNDEKNRTMKIYGDVEIPVYQRMNGDQLVAPVMFKLITSYTF